MTLLLDLGNTRLKAARSDGSGGLELLGEASHREHGMAGALARALGASAPGAGVAWCANVAGPAAGEALAAALAQAGGGGLSFLRAAPEACGVSCAYAEPARLGADRWAALLGARGLSAAPCVVVDAGSALTIDAMAAQGRHLGGWILPGLAMMVDALEARTGDLARFRQASAPAVTGGFPTDTRSAMEEGARLAALGAVAAAQERLALHAGAPARLFLTGGDAPALHSALETAELVPELVLLGLARAAAGNPVSNMNAC
ncbi:type III pantothenate kinase [Thioalkalivibrio sp. XN279]|uniref:type III pantothenate kinase n=1 Tax=Thioalkalivibrio sp. XN279 TaxID=2714953 RepID=UPI00140DFA41|nr:type III pantothenate kinase [Thioalkalivibrio sp. XN279]NHA14258.1 type III pantothenate kinase [Thioalkalivibrio sp. XN279]